MQMEQETTICHIYVKDLCKNHITDVHTDIRVLCNSHLTLREHTLYVGPNGARVPDGTQPP